MHVSKKTTLSKDLFLLWKSFSKKSSINTQESTALFNKKHNNQENWGRGHVAHQIRRVQRPGVAGHVPLLHSVGAAEPGGRQRGDAPRAAGDSGFLLGRRVGRVGVVKMVDSFDLKATWSWMFDCCLMICYDFWWFVCIFSVLYIHVPQDSFVSMAQFYEALNGRMYRHKILGMMCRMMCCFCFFVSPGVLDNKSWEDRSSKVLILFAVVLCGEIWGVAGGRAPAVVLLHSLLVELEKDWTIYWWLYNLHQLTNLRRLNLISLPNWWFVHMFSLSWTLNSSIFARIINLKPLLKVGSPTLVQPQLRQKKQHYQNDIKAIAFNCMNGLYITYIALVWSFVCLLSKDIPKISDYRCFAGPRGEPNFQWQAPGMLISVPLLSLVRLLLNLEAAKARRWTRKGWGVF